VKGESLGGLLRESGREEKDEERRRIRVGGRGCTGVGGRLVIEPRAERVKGEEMQRNDRRRFRVGVELRRSSSLSLIGTPQEQQKKGSYALLYWQRATENYRK
jgi:hypothetical protein